MATLIQSKQIQGVVTASVIEGDFNVQGDIIATGSNSIFGDITGSSVSASYIIGDGSGITGINYSQIGNTPVFLPGQNVTITSSSNEITFHAVLDGTGSDVQNLSISGDQLTIIGGNSITIPTGSNVSEYSDLTNVPTGIVSASAQIISKWCSFWFIYISTTSRNYKRFFSNNNFRITDFGFNSLYQHRCTDLHRF